MASAPASSCGTWIEMTSCVAITARPLVRGPASRRPFRHAPPPVPGRCGRRRPLTARMGVVVARGEDGHLVACFDECLGKALDIDRQAADVWPVIGQRKERILALSPASCAPPTGRDRSPAASGACVEHAPNYPHSSRLTRAMSSPAVNRPSRWRRIPLVAASRLRESLDQRVLVVAALLGVVVFGGWLRLSGANWDSGNQLHPDERYLTRSLHIQLAEFAAAIPRRARLTSVALQDGSRARLPLRTATALRRKAVCDGNRTGRLRASEHRRATFVRARRHGLDRPRLPARAHALRGPGTEVRSGAG